MYIHPNLHQTSSNTPIKTYLGIQSVISAKHESRTYPYSFAKHIHKSVELYLLDSGTCCMDIGNRQLTFSAGDLILIYPQIVHSFYLKEAGTCTFRHIHFYPNLFLEWYINPDDSNPSNLLTSLIPPFNNYFHLSADQKISAAVDKIIEESGEKNMLSDAMANLHIAELLLCLIGLTQKKSALMLKKDSHLPTQLQYVSFALTYIHENYDQKILIPDIAAHLNISARYLNKIFFQHMNLTILNYINMYRINQAIDLMTNTTLTLTEIAIQAGCKDSQHFSKLFKNIIGLPPNRYRKLILHDTHDLN